MRCRAKLIEKKRRKRIFKKVAWISKTCRLNDWRTNYLPTSRHINKLVKQVIRNLL